MKKIIFISLVLVILLSPTIEGQQKEGEILAVNDNTHTILFSAAGEIKEYSLALNNKIRLNEREVSINALAPIKEGVFQEAIIEINQAQEIERVSSFYKAIAISVEEITDEEIVVKDLNKNQIIRYKLDDDIYIKRNNHLSKREDVALNDQGLIILGIAGRLRKLILNNYRPVH